MRISKNTEDGGRKKGGRGWVERSDEGKGKDQRVSVCLSVRCLSLSAYLSVCVAVGLSAWQKVWVAVCLSVYLAARLSVCLAVFLLISGCLSVSVSPSVYPYLHGWLSMAVRVTNPHYLHYLGNYPLSGHVWPLNFGDLILKSWVEIPPRKNSHITFLG